MNLPPDESETSRRNICPNPFCQLDFTTTRDLRIHMAKSPINCSAYLDPHPPNGFPPLPTFFEVEIADDIHAQPPTAKRRRVDPSWIMPSQSESPSAPQSRPMDLQEPPSDIADRSGEAWVGTPCNDGSGHLYRRDPNAGWAYLGPNEDGSGPLARVDDSSPPKDRRGTTHWQHMWDECQNRKGANRWYPFADKREWQVAEWLIQSDLPQRRIDAFLALLYVRKRPDN